MKALFMFALLLFKLVCLDTLRFSEKTLLPKNRCHKKITLKMLIQTKKKLLLSSNQKQLTIDI